MGVEGGVIEKERKRVCVCLEDVAFFVDWFLCYFVVGLTLLGSL